MKYSKTISIKIRHLKIASQYSIMSFLLIICIACNILVFSQQNNRVIVLSNIEADPDDTQSLIRFLTYSNQWDVEEIIATSSIHQKTRVAPESILKVLDAYHKIQPNLLKHEKGYATAAELKLKVKKGFAVYGMSGVGEGKDSEGSDWIIQELEKNDERPVWFSVWGGGRMVKSAANSHRWEDDKTVTDFNTCTKKQDAAHPQIRWINVLQNDFAARANWCVNNYATANHAPVVKLKSANNIKAKPGAIIKLSGSAKDSDGNTVSLKWWQYEEVDTNE